MFSTATENFGYKKVFMKKNAEITDNSVCLMDELKYCAIKYEERINRSRLFRSIVCAVFESFIILKSFS